MSSTSGVPWTVQVWAEVFVRVTDPIWWPVAPYQLDTFAPSCVARQTPIGFAVDTGDWLGLALGTGLGSALGAADGAIDTGPDDGPGVLGPPQPTRPSARPHANRTPRIDQPLAQVTATRETHS
jgi:hypothetical protein